MNVMLSKSKHMIVRLTAVIMAVSLLWACTDLHGGDFDPVNGVGGSSQHPDRLQQEEVRDVLILYSAGFNSLSPFLLDDINDLKGGYLPGDNRRDDVLLVYSHLPESYRKYNKPTSPVLMRLYQDGSGKAVADTLVVYEKGTVSASAMQLKTVLDYVVSEFPAKGYGMIFSSHATGWLPSGYYSNSKDYENGEYTPAALFSMDYVPSPVPYVAPEYDPSLPLTKSIGQDNVIIGEDDFSYEIDLPAFADAIPQPFDYILFDACLMGGVEVAYQLRDKCGLVGFSQTEVLAEGLNYKTLVNHLLGQTEPDPVQVCDDFYAYYDAQNGVERSATVSVVDCSMMEPLAKLCAELFDRYNASISTLPSSRVQRYYRYSYHWFYDLESILVEAGISAEELALLHDALNECVVYKAATPSFMDSFDIDVCSGFSMFLPSHGGARLKQYYKQLDWNIATGLVK